MRSAESNCRRKEKAQGDRVHRVMLALRTAVGRKGGNARIEDLLPLPDVCGIDGKPLDWAPAVKGFPKERQPSIDRIDASRGYDSDNVRIVSWRMNRLRSNGSGADFATLADDWIRLVLAGLIRLPQSTTAPQAGEDAA